MGYRKMMMAVSAGLLFAVGSARAVERVDGVTASAQQEMSRDARGGGRSDPARTKTDVMNTDRSGYVTHDELEKHDKALFERLDRELNPGAYEPTFTDAG